MVEREAREPLLLPDARILRAPRLIPGSLLGLGGASAVTMLFGTAGSPAFALGALGAVFFTFLAGLTWLKMPQATVGRGALTVDDRGISLHDALVVRRASIGEGTVIPNGDRTRVLLARRGLRPAVEVITGSVEEGRSLLRALGKDPSRKAASFPLYSRSLRSSGIRRSFGFAAAVAAGIMTFCLRIGQPSLALIPAIAMLLFVLGTLLNTTRVTVGADGVRVRWLWGERFHPLADIERVEVEQGQSYLAATPTFVRLHLVSGKTAELVLGYSGGRHRAAQLAELRTRGQTIAERIEEALATSRDGAHATATAALARSARHVSDWVKELRALAIRTPTFRSQAALAPSDLLRIVEDPIATHEARAAAAVALTPHLDDDGRARVRVAAEATAAPKLRVALLAAVSGDDHAVTTALEELEEERPTDSASRFSPKVTS